MTHIAFSEIDHRPWPCPEHRWTWRQSWCDLLFMHWPVSAEKLRPLIPEALELDHFEGQYWIGLVPFRMEGVTKHYLPDLPWLSAFPELNVRTYVTYEGKPGVWFFSLDATNLVAVKSARAFFNLPYFWADIKIDETGGLFRYESRRKNCEAKLELEYKATDEPYLATPASLEYWLTERYCLYASDSKNRLYRTEIHHVPWPLQKARATVMENTMCDFLQPDYSVDPILHFAKRLDVVVWSPEPLRD